MKRFYLLLLACLTVNITAMAQYDCSNGRFLEWNYFSDFEADMGVTFGSGPAVGTGQTQTLKMDIYEPQGDTLSSRPLVILAFGGSFISGARQDLAQLCEVYSKMGYVTATIDYRVGFFFPSQVTTTQAVVRGMHDMKAAVRYFYKDAQTTNTYKVDTNFIFVGGVSAGAITAIHTAYLNDNSEIPAYLYNDTAGMGGVEGLSGNPGYSSKVTAVLNFSGTIGDSSWIDPNDVPIVSLHDIGDGVVPYGTAMVSVGGLPTGLQADGTGSIHKHMNDLQIPNRLITVESNGHVSYFTSGGPVNQNLGSRTAINYSATFMKDMLCGNLSFTPSVSDSAVALADVGVSAITGVSPSNCVGNYDFSQDSIVSVTLVNNGGPFPSSFPIQVKCTVNGTLQVTDTVVPATNWAPTATLSHTFSQAIQLTPNGPNDIVVNIGHYEDVLDNDTVRSLVGNFSPPVADFSVGSLCQNGVEFEDNSSTSAGTLSYNWSFGDGNTSNMSEPTHTYMNTGSQTVTLEVIATTGCADTTEQTITVIEAPTTSLGSLDVVCDYDSEFMLTGGMPSGGTYSGNGVSNGSFDPDAAGVGTHDITYTYEAPNGCSSSATSSLEVDNCSGVEDYVWNGLSIYPNPVDGIFTISVPNKLANEAVNYYLVDITGKTVASATYTSNTITIDRSSYPAGLYTLVLNDANGNTFAEKLIFK